MIKNKHLTSVALIIAAPLLFMGTAQAVTKFQCNDRAKDSIDVFCCAVANPHGISKSYSYSNGNKYYPVASNLECYGVPNRVSSLSNPDSTSGYLPLSNTKCGALAQSSSVYDWKSKSFKKLSTLCNEFK